MKQFIKNFNNVIKKTIFKVQNKTNNNFKVSDFNKYIITFIALLFVYLFYLLIPILYDKTWVQANIESKILNKFKLNISTSTDISYRILPSPHFLIKDSKILVDDDQVKKSIAEIKNLKVFLSQINFFDRDKMYIKKLAISDANFSLSRNDLKLINKVKSKKLSNNKIKINNSNIFFKDNLGETILIIKIDKSDVFFDDKDLLNIFKLKGKVFNTPFNLNFQYQINPNEYTKIKFNAKKLKLIFSSKSVKKSELISGENSISFLKSLINTKYDIKEKMIFFKSYNSRLNNSKINFNGKLTINPFDLNLDINLDNHKIFKLLDINSTLVEFIKSGLLFNNNISVEVSIIVNSNEKNEIFHDAKINLSIINGKINFDKTMLINDSIGTLELSRSNLFVKNDNLLLNTDILFRLKDADKLFSFLHTNKRYRKNFQTILVNLDYDFLTKQVKFNNIKIDNNKIDDELLTVMDSFNDNSFNNLNKSRRLVNDLLSFYMD